MIIMFSKKSIKVTGIALASLMTFGFVGATASVTEASSHNNYEIQELSHRRDYRNPPPRQSNKKYSEGERNTAAILGAIVGAVIAKNT